MGKIQNHLRKTFLAGIFAAVPVAVTGFIVWYVDNRTRWISERLFGRELPVIGVLIAVGSIYLCGLVATTLLGRFFLRLIDLILSRLPILRQFYTAWKQVALTPAGTEGTFSRVVLISDETGKTRMLGFCSGRTIEPNHETYCVFIRAAPNPMTGRLYFVRKEQCVFIDVMPDEAFKAILSTGNYIPPAVGEALKG